MKNTYKFLVCCSLLALCSCMNACNKTPGDEKGDGDNPQADQEVAEMLGKVGAAKTMDSFDISSCGYFYYELVKGTNSPQAKIAQTVFDMDKKEGKGAWLVSYSFSGNSSNSDPEHVAIQRRWGDFRSDLSFHPLGVSVWIKGRAQNKGTLRFMLMQEEDTGARQFFAHTDRKILSNDGWTRLVMPYEWFKPYSGNAGTLNLARVNGFRIEILNEGSDKGDFEFLMDDYEQLTSYKPEYGKPKFKSLFIQLNQVYQNTDWEEAFNACKAIDIDTWIIQYSNGFGAENNVSWYAGSNAEWITQEYDIIDKMVAAAEKTGFKLIFGLFGGDYNNQNTALPAPYRELYRKNKIIVDEVYDKFGDSPCFAGWYITEEFHDGTWPMGWHSETSRNLLAQYLQDVASYAKGKPKKFDVAIAPALWRGGPADKIGKWFEMLFEDTPDIDYLYLQDCAGRCLVQVDVDLPNYYSHIKAACDKTGVKFGVDIESFLSCSCPTVDYRNKTWEELEEQLYMAGLFTEHITNFSWATFKPNQTGFEGYRKYLQDNNLLGREP